MSRKSLWGLLLLVQVSGLGCAAVVRESTKGALEAVNQQKDKVNTDQEDSLTRDTAGQMTRGALDALITGEPPPKAQQLEKNPGSIASSGGGESGKGGSGGGGTPASTGQAAAAPAPSGSGALPRGGPTAILASQMARGLTQEIERQLGKDGSGPLGQSMSAVAGQVATSVIRQSKAELGPIFPECEKLEGAAARDCQEARVSHLSESVGAGLVRGMFKAAQPVLLIVAFGGGLLMGLLLFLALSMVRLHRESRGPRESGGRTGALRPPRTA